MPGSKEYEAAYYTFLRAVEERDGLLRYGEHLEVERARIEAFMGAIREDPPDVPRKMRRPLDATARSTLEAVGRRRAVVLDELGRLDDRLAAAEDFVRECEEEVASLRP